MFDEILLNSEKFNWIVYLGIFDYKKKTPVI